MIQRIRFGLMLISVLLLLSHSFVPHEHSKYSSDAFKFISCKNSNSDSILDVIISAFQQDLGDEHLSIYQRQFSYFSFDIDSHGIDASLKAVDFSQIPLQCALTVHSEIELYYHCALGCSYQRGPPNLL